MQLRNPSVFRKPRTAGQATGFCETLRRNPAWEFGDYEPDVSKPLWEWAANSTAGFRHIIEARLALTLRHHGVTHFATANVAHFEEFGVESDSSGCELKAEAGTAKRVRKEKCRSLSRRSD